MECELCSICELPLENDCDTISTVKKIGLKTLINKSKVKKDLKYKEWEGKQSCRFHDVCRKRYQVSSDKTKFVRVEKSAEELPPSTSTERQVQPTSQEHEFNFLENCVFCGNRWYQNQPRTHKITQNFVMERILTTANVRNDEVGDELKQRLHGIASLVSVQARYHKACYDNFFVMPMPKISEDEQMAQKIVEKICKYIEESKETKFYLSELQKVMGNNRLSNRRLYRKLKERYGNDIIISQHPGQDTIIYYKYESAAALCDDLLGDSENYDDLQKKNILRTAAEILKHEILAKKYETESYRASGDFLDSVAEDIPVLLNYFLSSLILPHKQNDPSNFVKRDNIAHAIISSIRPNSFTSYLQLAVGTYIYKKTGSRLIIDLLTKLGVSASYYHLQLFEASTMMDPPTMSIADDVFVQYVFDNTDHNAKTLDGKRTFHCLGRLAAYTPESGVTLEGSSKKCKKMPSAAQLASCCNVETVPYRATQEAGLKTITFEDVSTVLRNDSTQLPPHYLLYLSGKSIFEKKLPSWRGFMEVLSFDLPQDSVSRIVCLPFINEPPSKHTSINTAIVHAMAECKRLKQKTCIVTFDQPLFIKATEIVAGNDEMKNVVVRLGGFHTLMSFLGSIGYIMDGSGLEDIWGTVYASESVKNMMSGKAFSRALRAHILTYTAIGTYLYEYMADELSLIDLKKYDTFVRQQLTDRDENPPSYNFCQHNVTLNEMSEIFLNQLNLLKSNGPTAKLFVQYFEMVTIALQFIEAERLGNWQLHLQSVKKMLPFFHASGHFLYAKSAQIYLQSMIKLEMEMDDEEYRLFTEEGYFTIRRSYKAWSGIWSDMTIEQTLNRFFGTDLTHGRGVTPSVVARYLACMPTSFAIMDSLETYCDLHSSTSEQHVDLSNSRLTKDYKDLQAITSWLEKHKPFELRKSITSLSTGIVGGDNINCHEALELGKQSMSSMIGKAAENVSMTCKFKVKPLSSAKQGVHIDNKFINVNSTLLFQRICVLTSNDEELTKKAFKYELSPFPLSLFDSAGFMRKTQKSELFRVFRTSLQSDMLLSSFLFVVDGGFLLHQVTWSHGKTYLELFQSYRHYIVTHFTSNAVVVFDGYSNEQFGVKSYERYRRQEKNVAADVDFDKNMLVTLTQTKFLSNICNKHKFVESLSEYLKSTGIKVKQADEDADLLIVNTAIDLKNHSNSVAVVGNDIDLLVLLIGLTPANDNIFFYKLTSSKKSSNKLYSTSDNKIFKDFILFAHAFAGCDTTSALFGKGKKRIIKILEKNEEARALSEVFNNPVSSVEDLQNAATSFIFYLYGHHDGKLTLEELRYKIFVTLTTQTKTEIRLASLPPTSSALLQHSKRVFYQIQKWQGSNLQPEEWGWKRLNLLMIPIMTTDQPAPEELLQQMFCSCNTNCATQRCGCRKAGLRCSQVCKNCSGITCNNAQPASMSTVDEEDITDLSTLNTTIGRQ